MFFPAHLRACLFLVAALIGTGAVASNDCPIGEIRCASGVTASGGCFDPAVSQCHDGLICAATLAVCRRGSIGPGACLRSRSQPLPQWSPGCRYAWLDAPVRLCAAC